MDFFERQAQARRNTWKLVALFMVAVVLIVLAVDAAFALTTTLGDGVLDPLLLIWTSAGTLAVILGGAGYKTLALRGGGEAVALSVGGRPLSPSTGDPSERRLLNVVEEMSIASGVPMPKVFVLDGERSINAFAAGRTFEDAALGVTRGAADRLSRDELQGVCAHEFSHILNGDMRLNINLMAVLHGILVIAVIGQILMRLQPRSSSRGKKDGASIALLGLALLAIGWIGVLFGRMIKSAVSRQREYLADAAAVQFTRNPDGLAGALKKIGGIGSRVASSGSEDASHFFIGDAVGASWFGWMDTHPPLAERIRRLDPTFDGDFSLSGEEAEEDASSVGLAGPPSARRAPIPLRRSSARTDSGLLGLAGTMGVDSVAKAADILAEIPAEALAAARDPAQAAALVLAMAFSADPVHRAAQSDEIRQCAGAEMAAMAERLRGVLPAADVARLAAAGVAGATLRHIPAEEYSIFRQALLAVRDADGMVDLFEYALCVVVLRTLDIQFRLRRPAEASITNVNAVSEEIGVVLGLLAKSGQESESEAGAAFAEGASKLRGLLRPLSMPARERLTLMAFDQALERLAEAGPKLKKEALEACQACVFHDGVESNEEGVLFRCVASALGCPLPAC